MEGIAILAGIFGVPNAIFWLVIGWRAMRAHERLADAASEWVEKHRPPRAQNPAFIKTPAKMRISASARLAACNPA